MFHLFRNPISRRLGRALPLLALAGAGIGLMACHHHSHHASCRACNDSGNKAAKVAKHFSKQLDLDESQKSEVEALFRSAFEDACKLHGERGQIKSALLKDLNAADSNHQDLAAALDQASHEIDTFKSTMLERYSQLMAVLTPEQRRKLAKLIESHS